MKKMMSVLLAVVMLFAVCVPAFAADITQETKPAVGDTIVKTNIDKDGDGQPDADLESFTVTFPAEQKIDWGSTTSKMEYTVTASLIWGKNLTVTVADKDGKNALVFAPAGKTFEIPYQLYGTTTFTTTDSTANAVTSSFTMDIAADAWKTVPVAEYGDTLQFTVEVQ